MTRWFVLMVSAVTLAEYALGADLTLNEAVRVAAARPYVENINVEVALSRVRMLEIMSGRKLTLTPQLGLLSLASVASPVGLAANLGTALLSSQRNVSRLAILDARVDLLSAKVVQQRSMFDRELGVTREFYELAESQKLASRACDSWEQARARRGRVQQDLTASRITRAELIRFEQRILDSEVQCQESEYRRAIAAARLSASTGQIAADIRARDDLAIVPAPELILQPAARLIQFALTQRSPLVDLREEVSVLRKAVEAERPPRMFQLPLGRSAASQPDSIQEDAFQSTNTGAAVRTNSGDDESSRQKRYLRMKLAGIETQLDGLQQDIQETVIEARVRAEKRREEVQIARKRAALAREQREIAATRYRAGLEAVAYLDAAEDWEREADSNLARSEYESSMTLSMLVRLCGINSPAPGLPSPLLAPPVYLSTLP